ncbi:MAG TPA: hypothetical protein VH722_12095 [Alphaproteobacteria bacterium]|nr:hypothetical protein [Alphaproteobacteria bacterium]
MSAAVRAAFFLVPLLAAPLAHADRQAEDAQLNAAFAVEYDPQQMTALEPGVIAASGGWAKRDGATLSLNTEKSAAVTLTNDESGCQPDHPDHLKCYDFTLLAYLPGQHAFLVAESFDEGGKVLMIDDRTGTRTEFTELPRFSPDGKLLLVISNDEESNVGTIELWGRDGDMVKKLWTAPDTVGAEQVDFVAWNDDGIQLDLSFSQGDDKPEHHRPATLANGKSGWALTFKDGK